MAENDKVKGQSEEPSISFDSAKIADREKVEQFTKVDGEKQRLAAAEREKKEAAKKQEAAREAKIEQIIEYRRAERKSKKPLIITVAIAIILLILAGIAAFFIFNKPEPTTEEKIETAKTKAEEIDSFVDEKMKELNRNDATEQVRKKYEEELDKIQNDYDEYYVLLSYANYLYVFGSDNESLKSVLARLDGLSYRDEFYDSCQMVMYRLEDEEWRNANQSKVEECTTDASM